MTLAGVFIAYNAILFVAIELPFDWLCRWPQNFERLN